MDTERSKTDENLVDKDRFDAVLRKMIATKPLPLKEVVGTSNLRRTKKSEPASD